MPLSLGLSPALAQTQTAPQAPVQAPIQASGSPQATLTVQEQAMLSDTPQPLPQAPTTAEAQPADPGQIQNGIQTSQNAGAQNPAVNSALTTPANPTHSDPAVDPSAPSAQTTNQSPPASVTPAAASLYRSRWAQDSVQVLQENGIQLPQGINYAALINQTDFVHLLGQISSVPDAKLSAMRLQTPGQEPSDALTRGEAIHLVLGSFGLTESLPGFAKQGSKFTDLPPSHPAYASIVLAESVHLINGYPDRTIRPNERLSWGEALILVETVYSWRKALPTTAPEWVRNYQQRQNMWYQLIDGFRLLLTLAYVVLAFYFLGRTWLKARRQKQSPYRNFSFGLAVLTLLLGTLWISELLFNYALIPREVYASLAMLSVFAGLYLLKLGSDIDSDLSKPKPQVVIDAGYVTSINHEKGELFIRDKVSESHSLALVGSDSKILRKTGKKSVESAFLSDVQIGDLISVRGSRLEHESLVQVERLTLVEQAEQQVETTQQQGIREYVQAPQQQQQQQQNRISRS
jgi:hypothetical protein